MTQITNTQFNQTATQLAKMLNSDMRNTVFNQLLLQKTDSNTVSMSACDTYMAVKHTMPIEAAGELADVIQHHGLLLDANDVRAASKLLGRKRNPAELQDVSDSVLVFHSSKDDLRAEIKYQHLKDLVGYDQYSPHALDVWDMKDDEPTAIDFNVAEVYEIAKATFRSAEDKYVKDKRRLTFINYKGQLEALTFDDSTNDNSGSLDVTDITELGRTNYKTCPESFYKSFGAKMLYQLLGNVMPFTEKVDAFSGKLGNYFFETKHNHYASEKASVVESQFAMGHFRDHSLTYADLVEARQAFTQAQTEGVG